jgi:hypothetical protein
MGDGRDSVQRLAREMQKAAEKRPLIGERKGPYAMRENTIGGRLAQETGPAEVLRRALSSIDPRSSYSLDLREGGYRWPMKRVAEPNVERPHPAVGHALNTKPARERLGGQTPQFLFRWLDTPSRGKMSMQSCI